MCVTNCFQTSKSNLFNTKNYNLTNPPKKINFRVIRINPLPSQTNNGGHLTINQQVGTINNFILENLKQI